MVKEQVVIKNPTGLHLRPAGLFCKTAMQFECKIIIERKNQGEEIQSNAKSVLSILGSCIKSGDVITIACDGKDEEEALRAMVQIVEDGLGE